MLSYRMRLELEVIDKYRAATGTFELTVFNFFRMICYDMPDTLCVIPEFIITITTIMTTINLILVLFYFMAPQTGHDSKPLLAIFTFMSNWCVMFINIMLPESGASLETFITF